MQLAEKLMPFSKEKVANLSFTEVSFFYVGHSLFCITKYVGVAPQSLCLVGGA